jgi:hypothetical protein
MPVKERFSQVNIFPPDENKTGKKRKVSLLKEGRDFLGNAVDKQDIKAAGEKAEKYISEHSDLSEASKNNLRQLILSEGSNKEEVRLLLGEPTRIIQPKDKTQDASEIWLYKSKKSHPFNMLVFPLFPIYEVYCFYFKENVLTEIEKHYWRQTLFARETDTPILSW